MAEAVMSPTHNRHHQAPMIVVAAAITVVVTMAGMAVTAVEPEEVEEAVIVEAVVEEVAPDGEVAAALSAVTSNPFSFLPSFLITFVLFGL